MTQEDGLPENASETASRPPPTLSQRAKDSLKNTSPAAEAMLAKVFGDQYSPENPNGLCNAGVAENSLMSDWLLEEFNTLQLDFKDLTYGDALTGSQRIFCNLSKLFQNYFHPLTPVTSKHMVAGVGVSAVLDQLCDKVCDAGDSILIAAPYYNGFDNDLSARAMVKPVGVPIPDGVDPTSPQIFEAFEAKLGELKQKGQTVRAVIMTNPNNPLGFIYPRETILAYCRFCEKHNLHLISDEIYALSLYKSRTLSTAPEFQSILSIDVEQEAGCNPARVHVVYGMSKDFGANGLRIGVLVSQHNKELISSFGISAILMKISSPADALWSAILADDKKLAWYIDEAQSRAGEAIDFAYSWLDKMHISHSKPVAGHFIWIDVNAYLPKRDGEGKAIESKADQEMELFSRLLFKYNVYVAPGGFYHSPKPGFFRLTFTLKRPYMEEALRRFEECLSAIKKENEV